MRVAVITSTIGRPELRQCIESVKAQTYPAEHYIFVNGRERRGPAQSVLLDFAGQVSPFFLPDETGDYGHGPSMAGVFAAAPFLTSADWIFYLDDDNFYDPNHVASIMAMVEENALGWAYSLRRWVAKDGSPICDDDWGSIGHGVAIGIEQNLVDNSCYAISRPLAQRLALAWTAAPRVADRCMFIALKESGVRAGCTGLSTVNYRIGTGTAQFTPENIIETAEMVRETMPNGFPWRKPQVFG